MTTSQKISAMQNLKRTGQLEPISDELNPQYVFQMTATELLCKIVSGGIDAPELAFKELRNRGLDENGVWVGFGK